ncbi:mitochondrial fission process protein 1 isoform X1 [Gopherus flavomarginatus]|uniref:mitochondrial fission process protein 1 isoform X1 n=1 Tax=Gopherus flavomarginatus TaxID=286002 RepID=UPI0021CBBAF7|nr:mitochondrial fission process protein 1 isoform X1 [Gopherus flavomarginatus]
MGAGGRCREQRASLKVTFLPISPRQARHLPGLSDSALQRHLAKPAGYANEVGESFRAIVPISLVWGSYGVATTYVMADAIDKGKKAAVAHEHDVGKPTQVAVAVVDTFVWQALASVAIPGFTINRICAASLYFLGTMTHWPLPIRKWMTTAIGLSAIPVIIKPIDRSVDFLMDSSLRKLYGAEEKRRPSS